MSVSRTKILGAAVAALVAAGGGAALAVNKTGPAAASPAGATGSERSAERNSFMADVANRLGVSVEDLRNAVREAAEERGWKPDRGERVFGPRHGHHRTHWHAVREAFDAAGEYLGLSRSELKQRLRSGQSLADVAEAQGRSLDGLKQAIRAAVVERLDAAVADGRLGEERKQRLLNRLDAIIDDLVERARAPRR